MGKAKKIIIGVVVTALVGTGIGGGLLYVRKGSQKEVLVASVSDLAGERYDSDTTLSGTVYANATQRISIEKDMIIQEIYVSKGDEVKPGDKLISFDMTLVEMELNIAKLKLQKQQQDLAAAKKRLTSLQNGGPILDSDSSSADNLIDSGEDSTEDDSSALTGDDELSSAVTASDHYLAAVLQPMLLAAVTDGFADAQAVGNEEITSADTQEVGNEDIGSADEMTSGDTGEMMLRSAWDCRQMILKMIQRIALAIRVLLPDFMLNLQVMVLAVIFQTRIGEDFSMEAILVPHRIMLPLEMTDL